MIAIIDYGMGNQGSIMNMLKKIGAESKITNNLDEIRKADKIILPGVGQFGNAMNNLDKLNLIPVLHSRAIKDKIPFLGICLGMQLLAERSEEGNAQGLGWIKGTVNRFDFSQEIEKLKIPHMGWNYITPERASNLIQNLSSSSRFYFVHSFYFNCTDKKDVLAKSNYGFEFASIVEFQNIFGVQFHPEKSHKFGMQLLMNFAQVC